MDEIKEIILGALQDAAFMGYDKDDDESQEMFDDMYRQRNAYVKGYEKGYQEALAHIKSEVEQKIADKEKWLENVPLEDYVSSVASKEHNIKVGLTVAKNLIDSELNNKNK